MTRAAAVVAEVHRTGIVPVVVVDDASRARDLAYALRDGGIACAEFALRTPGALGALAAAAQVEGFVAGAGTVLTLEQADAARDAGAAFVVSPGFDPVVASRVAGHDIAMIPGVATATEVQSALAHGYRDLKIFPAGHLGGIGYLDALHGPFPDARFLPSGGVDEQSLASFLSRAYVLAASGSWMASRSAIAAGDFAGIAANAARSARIRDAERGRP